MSEPGIWIMLCFFVVLGACIGSFLNVVAYRMPRGESLVVRPSHCPHCNVNISLRDNLPVFGWFILGGRCRTCRLPISPRYPLVEALLGSLFLALVVVEVLSGGTNLPGYALSVEARLVSPIEFPDASLWGIYAYHCLLLSFLAALALIAYDDQRLPLRLVAIGIAGGLIGAAIWPDLHVVPGITSRPNWLPP